MGIAAIAQVLELIDPIIFGKIIDKLAVNTDGRSEHELIKGALSLLMLAVGIALLARLANAFTDYFTRLVVQKFGLSVFDEGLKHTLRLPYSEFKETGIHEELLENKGLYYAMWRQQIGERESVARFATI